MILSVNTATPVPVYEQIRAQVTELVGSGALSGGTRLPSVRQLANDLGVAPGTVAKAYQQLEAAGITRANRRHGTVVADRRATSETARFARLADAAATYAGTARLLNIDAGTASDFAAKALHSLPPVRD